ncbi:MAG: hypothetical protein KGL39_06125 [Patescibacteria group bacterium]|nr:hypothetical protein [Patescibacteria group bacterium]
MNPNRQLSFHIVASAALSILFWVMSAWFLPPSIAPEGYTYSSVMSDTGFARVVFSLLAILLIIVSSDAYAARRPSIFWFIVICAGGALFLGLTSAFGFFIKPIVPTNEVFSQAFAYGFAPTTLIVGAFITCISLLVGLGDRI